MRRGASWLGGGLGGEGLRRIDRVAGLRLVSDLAGGYGCATSVGLDER